MKKILVCILILLTLFLSVACESPSNLNNDDMPDNENVESNESNTGTDGNINNNTNNTNVLCADEIDNVLGTYSEGVVFVQKKNDSQHLHCIDKTGKILFSIVASSASSFSNGLASTSAGICDKNGKITTAQDLGGDEIVVCNFSADYILVKRSTTSYTGTVNELATFNTKFEKIVDFSSDFYDLYESCRYEKWIDKYFVFRPYTYQDKYLDLYTGTIVEGKASLYSKLKIQRASDYWDSEGYWGSVSGFYIYDELRDLLGLDNTFVLDLGQNEKYANIDEIGRFRNGIAPVTFEVVDGNGNFVYYYTIMDEKGDFKFEPVKTGGKVIRYSFENGYFVCAVSKGVWSVNQKLEVYDVTGKLIGEKDYTVPSYYDTASVEISDGIIVATINGVDYLYDVELTPVF